MYISSFGLFLCFSKYHIQKNSVAKFQTVLPALIPEVYILIEKRATRDISIFVISEKPNLLFMKNKSKIERWNSVMVTSRALDMKSAYGVSGPEIIPYTRPTPAEYVEVSGTVKKDAREKGR